MRYINSFMRSYKVIMEEKARQVEYMHKIEIEKILKKYQERLKNIEEKIKKN
jgi:hypothetical protein